ncbi:MAG: hypothetical protein U1A27_07315 [Phycisphaerae bacterium]
MRRPSLPVRSPYLWLAFAALVLAISLISGHRASRAAGAPQYLFTKTHVLVNEPYQPADARDAELERAFADAGEPRVEFVSRPMFVLGLLDAALPLIAGSGLLAALVAWRRRAGRGRQRAIR